MVLNPPLFVQLALFKERAATAEASLRASMGDELRAARESASDAKAKAEKELEEIKRASAGGEKELTERAARREEVTLTLTLTLILPPVITLVTRGDPRVHGLHILNYVSKGA